MFGGVNTLCDVNKEQGQRKPLEMVITEPTQKLYNHCWNYVWILTHF